MAKENMPPQSADTKSDGHSTTPSDLSSKKESFLSMSTSDNGTVPAADLKVGSQILSPFGRGIVLEISPPQVKVTLSSWKLAYNSTVTCFLNISEVRVLTTKPMESMALTEKCKLTQTLKTVACELYNDNRHGQALELFSWAVQICTALLQIDSLPKNERADLLVNTVKNSNHVGQCCIQLELWAKAKEAAESALALLDALGRKQQDSPKNNPAAVIKNAESMEEDSPGDENKPPSPAVLALIGQARLFGECRVKAYLILAQALHNLGEDTLALEKLDDAQKIVRKYATPDAAKQKEMRTLVKHFLSYQKKIKKLKRAIEKASGAKKEVVAAKGAAATPEEEVEHERNRKVWFVGENKPDEFAGLDINASGSVEDDMDPDVLKEQKAIRHVEYSSEVSSAIQKPYQEWFVGRSPFALMAYSTLLATGVVGTMMISKYLMKAKRPGA